MWALGWWLFRRHMRRRASETLAGISAVATPKRRFGALGGLLIVGLAVGAFVAWRRLAGDGGWEEPPFEPVPAPQPPMPVAA